MSTKYVFPYIPPVAEGEHRIIQNKLIEKSQDLFEEKHYKEGFHALLDALGEGLREKHGNADGTVFHIPHGSIVVDIVITDKTLSVSADFLQVPQGAGRVAMLRQVAELNNTSLMLPYFSLEGDKLKILYECALSASHPDKLLRALYNICQIGDKYDDEFCNQFGASRFYEPRVQPYSSPTIKRAYSSLQQIGNFTLELIEEANAKRWYGKSWFFLSTALFQIGYVLNPQGQLTNELTKAIAATDEEIPVEERVSKGVEFIKRLMAKTESELASDLYTVEMLVPMRKNLTLAQARAWLEDDYESCASPLQSGDYEQVIIRLTKDIYNALCRVAFPPAVVDILTSALQQASDADEKDAANILFEAERRILEEDLEQDGHPQKTGFPEGVTQTISESLSEVQAKLQTAINSPEIAALQIAMTAAMQKGEMADYMRLAMEMQQHMMKDILNPKEEE